MRLTVGSLPSAVYWRRRAMVLGTLVVVAGVGWASCSGSDPADRTKRTSSAASAAAGGSPSASASGSSAAALLAPQAQGSAAPSGSAVGEVSPGAANPAESPAGTQCADGDLQITPVPESTTAARGAPMRLTIKIRNISGHACSRDLGPDQQELYLLRDTVKIYSSDACDARHGAAVRNLAPGIDLAFWVPWDGTTTVSGCSARQAPAAGRYQLVGRLGAKTSEPVTVVLT